MIKKEMTDGLSLLLWFLPPPEASGPPIVCIGASSPKEGEALHECVAENIDKPQTLRLMTSQQSTQQANPNTVGFDFYKATVFAFVLEFPLWGLGGFSYLYNAAGQKLRKTVNDLNAGGFSTTEYLDGFQYRAER